MQRNFPDGSYEAVLKALFERFPSFGTSGSTAYKPGLERVERLCALLGNPQDKFRSVHVAGTNGKGSVCNMIAAHLARAGYRVGLYTSPHISDFRERMRIVTYNSAALVSKAQTYDFLCRWNDAFNELDLSLFEISTAMAFDFFASEKVDFAVVETGLGGRLDATNIITPQLSVITNIGYDHMNVLGSTLESIAREKAGIIKAGVPVVVGERGEETDRVFIETASEKGCAINFAEDGGNIPEGTLERMDLQGAYQKKNLRTACCALKVLGMEPDMDAICRTASICDFHGRWEKISDKPTIICDIGHNAHGLKYNFAQLESLLDKGEYTDLVMVYGSVADKDVDAVLRILVGRAEIFVTAAAGPRAMGEDELLSRAKRVFCREGAPARLTAVHGVAQAVEAALRRCGELDRPLLYIGGSTYVVSEAVLHLREKHFEILI